MLTPTRALTPSAPLTFSLDDRAAAVQRARVYLAIRVAGIEEHGVALAGPVLERACECVSVCECKGGKRENGSSAVE